MAITNNPDYQTTFDERDGTCCLTIEETFADDSARFTCQASNLAGFAQTTAVLRVQGILMNGSHPMHILIVLCLYGWFVDDFLPIIRVRRRCFPTPGVRRAFD